MDPSENFDCNNGTRNNYAISGEVPTESVLLIAKGLHLSKIADFNRLRNVILDTIVNTRRVLQDGVQNQACNHQTLDDSISDLIVYVHVLSPCKCKVDAPSFSITDQNACQEMVCDFLTVMVRRFHEAPTLRSLFVKVCHFCGLVLRLFDSGEPHVIKLLDNMLNLCLESLASVSCRTSTELSSAHDVTNTLDLLSRLLPVWSSSKSLNPNFETILRRIQVQLFAAVPSVSDPSVVKIFLEVLPNFPAADQLSHQSVIANEAWKIVRMAFEENDLGCLVETPCRNGFLLLGCSLEYLMANNVTPFWSQEDLFWRMLQCGLVHSNPLQRKRSIYFLKRALDRLQCDPTAEVVSEWFVWSPDHCTDVQKILTDLMLVLEMLEEKQVHVMKPLFPTVVNLCQATSVSRMEKGHLPVSWLLVVLHRMLNHDGKTVRKWAVEQICDMDFSRIPVFREKQKFFVHTFLAALNDTSLYMRQSNELIGSCSAVGNHITTFFHSCFSVLQTNERRAEFFRGVLQKLQCEPWGPVPLFWVVKALKELPQNPFWDLKSTGDIRELLVNSLRTHDPVLRGATQQFVLETFMNFVDSSDLSVAHLSSVLVLFKREECLRRGTPLYHRLVAWIRQLLSGTEREDLSRAEAVRFVTHSVLALIKENSDGLARNSLETLRIARMMVLLMDADLCSPGDCGLESALEDMMDTLKTCHSRPYMSPWKVELSLQFLLCLTNEAESAHPNADNQIDLEKRIERCFQQFLPQFLPFLSQQFFKNDTGVQTSLELYFDLLEYLIGRPRVHAFLMNFMIAIGPKCLAKLSKTLEPHSSASCSGTFVALRCFHLACKFSQVSSDFQTVFGKNGCYTAFLQMCSNGDFLSTAPRDATNHLRFTDRAHLRNPNRESSEYISKLWLCLRICAESVKNDADGKELRGCLLANHVSNQAVRALEIGGENSLKSIFNCLQVFLPRLLADFPAEQTLNVLEVCWKTLFDSKVNAIFWESLNALINLMFQPAFLANALIAEQLSQYALRIVERSESCHRLFLPLIRRMVAILRSPDHLHLMSQTADILVQALTFGQVHRKDQKVVHDTVAFVCTLGIGNAFAESYHLQDSCARVEALVLLLNFLIQDHPEGDGTVEFLVDRLIAHERKVTRTRKRHFANSLIHRVQQRVWQSMLLLQPFYATDVSNRVLKEVFVRLIKEGLQPSVRILLEWMAARILLSCGAELREQLWIHFSSAASRRVGSLGSFTCIVWYIGCSLTGVEQVPFIQRAFKVVLPWCMAQHFNTRIYAQVCLHQLWNLCKKLDLTVILNAYSPLEDLFSAVVEHSGSSKGTSKLLNDFMFCAFHPMKHYTIQTIFYEVPRLCKVADEEWIDPTLFQKHPIFVDVQNASFIPLLNPTGDDALSRCQPCSWTNKAGEGVADDCSGEEVEAFVFGEHRDVQRKLTPWKQTIPDYEALADHTRFRKQDQSEGLVVVASLIDRIPNLGGLCRTCEVFGVSQYVIGSLKFVEDKQFQSLSVSAERWVRITEVKIHELQEYLLGMKKCGYQVVGAEQTTNSCKLEHFTFPQKTVLVLGNEKEGIPVNLIQLLDVCVEIPQHGLIRSLNVHVAGAILIWEYARQRIQK